eukprot:2854983-Rhodomonas_salina.6
MSVQVIAHQARRWKAGLTSPSSYPRVVPHLLRPSVRELGRHDFDAHVFLKEKKGFQAETTACAKTDEAEEGLLGLIVAGVESEFDRCPFFAPPSFDLLTGPSTEQEADRSINRRNSCWYSASYPGTRTSPGFPQQAPPVWDTRLP